MAETKAKKSKNTSYAYKKFLQLCKTHKVTPYQVSVSTGRKVSTTVLSQWKNGEYDLKLDKLKAIADVFGEPVTIFIE